MDGFLSSDEVLCCKDAVIFSQIFSPNSANVYRTIRRFVEDEAYRKKVVDFVCVLSCYFCIYVCLMSKK